MGSVSCSPNPFTCPEWFSDPNDIPPPTPAIDARVNQRWFTFRDRPSFTTDFEYFGIFELNPQTGPVFSIDTQSSSGTWINGDGILHGMAGWGTYNDQIARIKTDDGQFLSGGASDFIDFQNAEFGPGSLWAFLCKHTVAGNLFEWKMWPIAVTEPTSFQVSYSPTETGTFPGFANQRRIAGWGRLFYASFGTDGDAAPRVSPSHVILNDPSVNYGVDNFGNINLQVENVGQAATRYVSKLNGVEIYDSGFLEFSRRFNHTIPTQPSGSFSVEVTCKDYYGVDGNTITVNGSIASRQNPEPPQDPIESPGVISLITDVNSKTFLGPTFLTHRAASGAVETFPGYTLSSQRTGFVMRTIGGYKQREWEEPSVAQLLHQDEYPVTQGLFIGPGSSIKKKIRLSDVVSYIPRGATDDSAVGTRAANVFYWGSHAYGVPESDGNIRGGIGFRVLPSADLLRWKVYMADRSNVVIVDEDTPYSTRTSRLLEIEYDAEDRFIRWYIDSVLVWENISTALDVSDYRGFGPAVGMYSNVPAVATFFTYPFQMVRQTDKEV
jgi:hypothetical protein